MLLYADFNVCFNFKDGRLRINDQIFQIGDTNVRSMSSEQVASVLRQSTLHGQMIKFIVARPVHNPVVDIDLVSSVKATTASDKATDEARLKSKLNSLNAAKHPNSKCFIIKTSDIMDKNVNLPQKISQEVENQISEEASTTTNENKQIETEECDQVSTQLIEDSSLSLFSKLTFYKLFILWNFVLVLTATDLISYYLKYFKNIIFARIKIALNQARGRLKHRPQSGTPRCTSQIPT